MVQRNVQTKMNSALYHIRSKMLHGTKVIILVEKNRKRVAWLGFELMTFILEVKSANHYAMDPSYQLIILLSPLKYK